MNYFIVAAISKFVGAVCVLLVALFVIGCAACFKLVDWIAGTCRAEEEDVIEECPHGYTGDWSDNCPDCRH